MLCLCMTIRPCLVFACLSGKGNASSLHFCCILSYLLFPAQICYLDRSIFRQSYSIINLCTLLSVLYLLKSRDLTNMKNVIGRFSRFVVLDLAKM